MSLENQTPTLAADLDLLNKQANLHDLLDTTNTDSDDSDDDVNSVHSVCSNCKLPLKKESTLNDVCAVI